MLYRFVMSKVKTVPIAGEKLVGLRRKKYWSRDDLVERSKMTRGALQRIEQGDTVEVTFKTLRKLAEAFDKLPEILEVELAPEGAKRSVTISIDNAAFAELQKRAREQGVTVEQLVEAMVRHPLLKKPRVVLGVSAAGEDEARPPSSGGPRQPRQPAGRERGGSR